MRQDNFHIIQSKLNRFIRKYYLRELVKGIILFILFGFFYILITAAVENFLWLPGSGRRILFYAQWLILGIFFLIFIGIPLLKLTGILKPISHEQAARLIGDYFPDIKDKLLNTLQLHKQPQQSDLLTAGILQKIDEFRIFKFESAVNFKRIYKFFPLLLIPVFIFLVLKLLHYDASLKQSYTRVLTYQKNYTPPLPYQYVIMDSLQVIQGQTYDLHIKVSGNTLPQQLFINLDGRRSLLSRTNDSVFSFHFPVVSNPVSFSLSDGYYHLGDFNLHIIRPPLILKTTLKVVFPAYLHRKTKIYHQNLSLTVPQSSRLIWTWQTQNVDSVNLGINHKYHSYPVSGNLFQFDTLAQQSFSYQIEPSNKYLPHYEQFDFDVKVIKDGFPKISVLQKKDTVNRQNYHKITATDDYGISALYLVYTDNQSRQTQTKRISFKKGSFLELLYVFPGDLHIAKGHGYSYYFKVTDNDAPHGYKPARSQEFHYNRLTDKQLENINLKLQQQNIAKFDQLKNTIDNQTKQISKLANKITSQKQLDWKTQKQLENALQQSQQQENFFKDRLQQFKHLLKKLPDHSKDNIKKDLEKRLAELAAMKKKQKLIDELKELAQKLKKEALLDKLKDLKNYSEHQEKSLERILELTKKYYLQQKIQKLAAKLDQMAQKQDSLAKLNNESPKSQSALNKAFDSLIKSMDSIAKANNTLKKPIAMPDTQTDMKDIKQDMEKAGQQLQNQQSQSANQSQKKAASKMKQLSKAMQKSMMSGGGAQHEEDIKTLQAILKSLLHFSFKEESLLTGLYTNNSKAFLPKHLATQNHLKDYFKQINDSLYTLALRNPKISQMILDEAFEIQNSLDKSLNHLSENQLFKTQSSARYILKASNTLANFLSNALDNMKNASPSMGQGQGKKGKGKSFSLPDIIKKQGEALSKAEQGKKQKQHGKKNGKGKKENSGKNNDGQSEAEAKRRYELYKIQQQVKDQLNQLGDKFSDQAQKKRISDLGKQMDELQKRILKEGITDSVIQKMIQLQHELLKLKHAAFKQHEDNKRIGQTNFKQYNGLDSLFLHENFKLLQEKDLLKRNQIPVNQLIRDKILKYLN